MTLPISDAAILAAADVDARGTGYPSLLDASPDERAAITGRAKDMLAAAAPFLAETWAGDEAIVGRAEEAITASVDDCLRFNLAAYGMAWTEEYEDSQFLCGGAAAKGLAAALTTPKEPTP